MRIIREIEYTKVIVLDGPDQSGACHEYEIKGTDLVDTDLHFGKVQFQKGPIKEFGITGCQNEDLAAIIIDRLEGFESGPFPCLENKIALHHFKSGLMMLEKRTANRKERGVEGKNEK